MATFMIVLIMKLMPQIKLCVIYKHGAITYKTRVVQQDNKARQCLCVYIYTSYLYRSAINKRVAKHASKSTQNSFQILRSMIFIHHIRRYSCKLITHTIKQNPSNLSSLAVKELLIKKSFAKKTTSKLPQNS